MDTTDTKTRPRPWAPIVLLYFQKIKGQKVFTKTSKPINFGCENQRMMTSHYDVIRHNYVTIVT